MNAILLFVLIICFYIELSEMGLVVLRVLTAAYYGYFISYNNLEIIRASTHNGVLMARSRLRYLMSKNRTHFREFSMKSPKIPLSRTSTHNGVLMARSRLRYLMSKNRTHFREFSASFP